MAFNPFTYISCFLMPYFDEIQPFTGRIKLPVPKNVLDNDALRMSSENSLDSCSRSLFCFNSVFLFLRIHKILSYTSDAQSRTYTGVCVMTRISRARTHEHDCMRLCMFVSVFVPKPMIVENHLGYIEVKVADGNEMFHRICSFLDTKHLLN